MAKSKQKKKTGLSRRRFVQSLGATAAIAGSPHLWLPKAFAQQQSDVRGSIRHLLYMRLNSGFRFTAAYNGNVASQFNPFGSAAGLPQGVEWGASAVMDRSGWLDEEKQAAGMLPMNQLATRIAVIPCVDHEPFSGSADGNHGTGLERFYTGYAGTGGYDGAGTGIFSMINYALRNEVATGNNTTSVRLPAFVLGEAGMARGTGVFAGYRPPVIEGTNFDRFRTESGNIPEWAKSFSKATDQRMRERQHVFLRTPVDAYIQSRSANERFNDIFQSPILDIDNNSDEAVDGFTQAQLTSLFGNSRAARSVRLALRLFHFGCPAVYFGQGGWDYHSNEESSFPTAMDEPNWIMSALYAALKAMPYSYPDGSQDGSSYWDHTLVVFGSEFGRTARGSRFNSARGSDHGGDLATRWMSMPMMGGLIAEGANTLALGGKELGHTRSSDLKAEGQVVSYRAFMKTLIDALGGDHAGVFDAENVFNFSDLLS
ncbi:MAG: DUF1501 domain-containing protein [Myxococcales bacterium]|nr:MAG: DUF1501 domain-containing protein [Myxococcales bacterium]